MNTKYLFTAIAVVVILVIGLFIYNQKHKTDVASQTDTGVNANNELDQNTNAADINSNTDVNSNANGNSNNNGNTNTGATNTNANTNSASNTNTSNTNTSVKPAVFQVTYDGTSFSPATLSINNGDVVIFKNTSSESFWPASNPHPTHTDYPEFDAKQAIPSGQTYQFKFLKSGSWGYHNHLNPSIQGTIVVK